jgi:hypothetical protein
MLAPGVGVDPTTESFKGSPARRRSRIIGTGPGCRSLFDVAQNHARPAGAVRIELVPTATTRTGNLSLTRGLRFLCAKSAYLGWMEGVDPSPLLSQSNVQTARRHPPSITRTPLSRGMDFHHCSVSLECRPRIERGYSVLQTDAFANWLATQSGRGGKSRTLARGFGGRCATVTLHP